jgi:hypothetical protein
LKALEEYKIGDTINLHVCMGTHKQMCSGKLLAKYERFWLFDMGGYKTCVNIDDMMSGYPTIVY